MVHSRHIPAVVLGGCVNALGVARALGSRGIPVTVVTSSNLPSPAADSRYVRHVWRYEGGDDEMLELLLARGGQLEQAPVLFPITDAAVMALSLKRDELRRFYRIGLPDHTTLERTISKRGFAMWAQDLHLPIPATLFINNLDHLRTTLHNMPFPCILKPEFQTPRGTKQIYLKTARADTPQQLLELYEQLAHVSPRAIVQQWIPGGDGDVYFCLQYYDQNSRPLVSFCGRKIRQWPPFCGSTASCEPVDDELMIGLATRFFSSIGFRGLCSMEFKRAPGDALPLLVEPTAGRTDWQSAVANVNGVPIPYIAYCDLVGLQPRSTVLSNRKVKWVRWPSDAAAADYFIKRGELSMLQWLYSIRPPLRWSVWSIADPAPYLGQLPAKVRYRAKRLWTRLLSEQPKSLSEPVKRPSPSKLRLVPKAWRYCREYGLRKTLYRLHRRRRFVIYAKNLTRGEPISEYPDVYFRVANEADLPLLLKSAGACWHPAIDGDMGDRLRSNDLAVLGVSAANPDEVLYASWVSSHDWLFDILHTDRTDRPRPDEECSRRIWVPTEHRRRGLAHRGLNYVECVAANRGVRRLWAFVLASNKPSRRLHELAGYESLGAIRIGRCLGKRCAEVRWKKRWRWTGLEWPEPPDHADDSA